MIDIFKIAVCLLALETMERVADFGGYLATAGPKRIALDFVNFLDS